MMNKLYKVFNINRLLSHLLLIVDILLMKKEKDCVFLFGSNSILLSSAMSAKPSDNHIDKNKFIKFFITLTSYNHEYKGNQTN